MISVCTATFKNTDVMELARTLRQLSQSSNSSLTELNISILSCPELMVILMEASPYITSMHIEIQTVWGYWNLPPHYNQTDESGDVKLEIRPESEQELNFTVPVETHVEMFKYLKSCSTN